MLMQVQDLFQVEKDVGTHVLLQYWLFVLRTGEFQWFDDGVHQRLKLPNVVLFC
jgi:hypothetical protein